MRARQLDLSEPLSFDGQIVDGLTIEGSDALSAAFGHAAGTRGPAELGEPFQFFVEVLRDRRLLAALSLEMRIRTAGRKEWVLEGHEPSGWLCATLTVDVEARCFTFVFRTQQKPALPASVLPLLRWLLLMRSPNEALIRSPLWCRPAPTPLTGEPALGEAYVQTVEALDEVQWRSGAYFDLPIDLTPTEVENILGARILLAGGVLHGKWAGPLRIQRGLFNERRVPPIFTSPHGGPFILEQEEHVAIRDHLIPLGRVRTLFESVRLSEASVTGSSMRDGLDVVELAPGASDRVRRQKVPPWANRSVSFVHDDERGPESAGASAPRQGA